MNNTSYWIWHYGDYEIYHTMKVHLRREERGYHRPAFWKLSMPYSSVKFRKEINSREGYLICHINGNGHILVDGIRYKKDTPISLSEGFHEIEVHVLNHGGLPAIYIESDICPSDGSWLCNHFAGEFSYVGFNKHFTSSDQNPEHFPFVYEKVLPISKEVFNGGILFDFGREIFGYLNIQNAKDDEVTDIFYGESREEALDTDYSYITDSVIGKNDYRLIQRAFRYIYIKTSSESLTVSADYEYLPLDAKGCFECDSELFNKIISAAKYTFHLNCREGYLDGIKRDRWIWSGDAYQSARINRYLFADKEIDQRTLIGLIGKLPIEQHINTIMDYSLLFIIMLYEHYMTFGDKEFLDRIYPMADELMSFCETRINSDGFIEGNGDDWTFIDWSDIDKCGAVCAEQILLIKAYDSMAFILDELGIEGSSALFAKSSNLKLRVNKHYWNSEKGAFIDSYQSGRNNVTRHANIFAVMYGIATKEQTDCILKNVLKNEDITKITTPYFEGYELDALAKLGDFKSLEDMVASYWGGMIDLGANTIWEEYDPSMKGIEHYAMYGGKYEKSLCHAWGAGPIYLFGRYYLGVYATSAGYKTFSVEPSLGGLSKIHGSVPINGGTVSVDLNKERLSVVATKDGGTLIWKGKTYSLTPGKELVLNN